jgi:hypothetical protein
LCPSIGDPNITHQDILCSPEFQTASIPATYSTLLAIIQVQARIQAVHAFWPAIYWEALRSMANMIFCGFDPHADPKANEAPSKVSDSSQSSHSTTYVSKRHMDNDGQNDGSEEPPPKKRKTLGSSSLCSQNRPLLACPFHKRSPISFSVQSDVKYQACGGPGWKSVSKIK